MSQHLGASWQETVARSPAAVALVDGETRRTWTRAALAEAATTWRQQLPPGARLGGRRVLIAEPNGARWFEVFLGLLAAGAVVMPADPTEPRAGLGETARTLGAAWLWHEGKLVPMATRRGARRGDECLVKLTSGSTGAAHGLAFTHAQMLADGRQVCATMGLGPDDLNLGVIPLGHSYGLGNLVVPLLDQGTAIVCAASPLPHVLAADCAAWRPTVFPAVPTLLRALTESDVDPRALASLRLVISAGAPLGADVAAAFLAKFGRRVHSFYGATETGGICYDRSGDATLSGRSVGAPLEGVRIDWRRGRRFVVTSAAVVGRGRFSPPDRGELNPQGELTLLGRTGRLVKIAGRRLDLAEIEAALRAVPGVREVFAIPHPGRADAIAAAIAGQTTRAELRRHLLQRLAAWKVPNRLLVLAEFPHTARGKVDRRQLEARLGRGDA